MKKWNQVCRTWRQDRWAGSLTRKIMGEGYGLESQYK